MTDPDTGARFRGFDTMSLLHALKRIPNLEREYGKFEVLNLSLGAVNCPSHMGNDPVVHWVENWLADSSRRVVVAAGNHGSDVPSWPAALAHDWSGFTTGKQQAPNLTNRVNVLSVGSEDPNGHRPSFTAQGAWVTHWADGDKIPVAHHGGPMVWSGTSFAAPRIAAQVAVGLLP